MLQKLLNEQVLDPKNPEKVYALAQEYDRLEQGAMAVSLYLKAADLSKDKILQYKSMISIGRCYDRQGNRRYTVEGAFLDAAALLPERPEAHYLLSKFYEMGNMWKNSLMHANIGLKLSVNSRNLDIGYPGCKALAFQAALAKWYVTCTQEGKHALFDLKFRTVLDT